MSLPPAGGAAVPLVVADGDGLRVTQQAEALLASIAEPVAVVVPAAGRARGPPGHHARPALPGLSSLAWAAWPATLAIGGGRLGRLASSCGRLA